MILGAPHRVNNSFIFVFNLKFESYKTFHAKRLGNEYPNCPVLQYKFIPYSFYSSSRRTDVSLLKRDLILMEHFRIVESVQLGAIVQKFTLYI